MAPRASVWLLPLFALSPALAGEPCDPFAGEYALRVEGRPNETEVRITIRPLAVQLQQEGGRVLPRDGSTYALVRTETERDGTSRTWSAAGEGRQATVRAGRLEVAFPPTDFQGLSARLFSPSTWGNFEDRAPTGVYTVHPDGRIEGGFTTHHGTGARGEELNFTLRETGAQLGSDGGAVGSWQLRPTVSGFARRPPVTVTLRVGQPRQDGLLPLQREVESDLRGEGPRARSERGLGEVVALREGTLLLAAFEGPDCQELRAEYLLLPGSGRVVAREELILQGEVLPRPTEGWREGSESLLERMGRGLRDAAAATADPALRLVRSGWTRTWHATQAAFERLSRALRALRERASAGADELEDGLRGSLDGWADTPVREDEDPEQAMIEGQDGLPLEAPTLVRPAQGVQGRDARAETLRVNQEQIAALERELAAMRARLQGLRAGR